MFRYVIGFGSNLGSSQTLIELSFALLKAKGQVVKISPYYRSKALGPSSRDFLNGAFLFQTELAPPDMLRNLHRVETKLGRQRLMHWGARTLDLDILWWSEGEFHSNTLVIPHREVRNRDFAFLPLLDLGIDLGLRGELPRFDEVTITPSFVGDQPRVEASGGHLLDRIALGVNRMLSERQQESDPTEWTFSDEPIQTTALERVNSLLQNRLLVAITFLEESEDDSSLSVRAFWEPDRANIEDLPVFQVEASNDRVLVTEVR